MDWVFLLMIGSMVVAELLFDGNMVLLLYVALFAMVPLALLTGLVLLLT
jgi:hypothetical protein